MYANTIIFLFIFVFIYLVTPSQIKILPDLVARLQIWEKAQCLVHVSKYHYTASEFCTFSEASGEEVIFQGCPE